MNTPIARRAVRVVAGGFSFFIAAMVLATGLAFYNARVEPATPWFPLLVLPLLFAVVLMLERRVGIGLASPPAVRWSRIFAFAVSSMLAAHCVLRAGARGRRPRHSAGFRDRASPRWSRCGGPS
jgi:hypothetical protein